MSPAHNGSTESTFLCSRQPPKGASKTGSQHAPSPAEAQELLARALSIGATSIIAYFVLYLAALLLGSRFFPNGNLAYYITAAAVLAIVGLAAAFRELRA